MTTAPAREIAENVMRQLCSETVCTYRDGCQCYSAITAALTTARSAGVAEGIEQVYRQEPTPLEVEYVAAQIYWAFCDPMGDPPPFKASVINEHHREEHRWAAKCAIATLIALRTGKAKDELIDFHIDREALSRALQGESK